MTIIYILTAAFAVMLMSLTGIFTVLKFFKGWAEQNLKYLATFATGVFIVVAYNLIKETTHSEIPLLQLLGLILIGAVIAFVVDKIIPNSHHHHDSNENPDTHTKAGAHRIILSDTLHNITDGFLIVPAFLVDIRLGILTTAGIMVHEIAQEISEFFVLKSAGYSNKQALSINFITSSSILIGVLGAIFIANISENIIFILLAIAAGIMIFTVLKDLIPYSYSVAKKEQTYIKHLVAVLAGIIIITLITSATADTHIHSEDAHSEQGHTDTHGASEQKHSDEPHTDPGQHEETMHTEMKESMDTHMEDHHLEETH